MTAPYGENNIDNISNYSNPASHIVGVRKLLFCLALCSYNNLVE